MEKFFKSSFKTLFFRGNYGWLPTVILFWYSFFFLILVQIYGPFAIVDDWFIVNFSRPGFALFNFVESQLLLPGQQGLRNLSYATPLRPLFLIFSLTLFGVFLLNFATIRLVRWTRSRRVAHKNPPVSP